MLSRTSSQFWMVLSAMGAAVSIQSELAAQVDRIMAANERTVDIRIKAIRVAIALTSGAYKTSLVSYFTHRDLFPSLMKV